MKRVASAIGGGVLVAGSLASCSAESSFTTPGIPDGQEAFMAVQQYWTSTGMFKASSVRLVTVSNGGHEQCSTTQGDSLTVRAFDPAVAHYCPDTDTIVVVRRAYQDFMAKVISGGVSKEHAELILMGHEFGHAVEKHRGQLEATDVPRLEALADCLGGQAIKSIAPEAATAVSAFYGSLVADGVHGSPAQREAHFMRGFSDATC